MDESNPNAELLTHLLTQVSNLANTVDQLAARLDAVSTSLSGTDGAMSNEIDSTQNLVQLNSDAITKESVERINADTQLGGRISDLSDTQSGDKAFLIGEIERHHEESVEVVTDLQAQIEGEKSLRESADEQLSNQVSEAHLITQGQLNALDEKVSAYDEALDYTTTDSTEITLDTDDVMVDWSLLSEAQMWRNEIGDYLNNVEEVVADKLRNYEAQTITALENANQALENTDIQALSDALLGRIGNEHLDAVLSGKIAGTEAALMQEIRDRVLAVSAESLTRAQEAIQNAKDTWEAINTERNERLDALVTEAQVRSELLAREALQRAENIRESSEELSADIQAEADARAKALTDEVTARTAAIQAEATARKEQLIAQVASIEAKHTERLAGLRSEVTASIAALNDGITQSVSKLTNADTEIISSLNAYKLSNGSNIAAIYENVEVLSNSQSTTAQAVSGLSTSFTGLAEDVATNTADILSESKSRTTADSALSTRIDSLSATTTDGLTKANAAINTVSEAVTDLDSATATKFESLDAQLTTVGTDVGSAKTAAANAQKTANSAVTTNTAQATEITNLKARVTTTEGDIATKASTNALNALTTQVEGVGADLKVQADSVLALEAEIDLVDSKADRAVNAAASAQKTADSAVTANTASAKDIVTLKSRVDKTEGSITKKADATAVTALETKVDSNEVAMSQRLDSLAASLTDLGEGAETLVDVNAFNALKSEVTNTKGVVTGHTTELTKLTNQLATVQGGVGDAQTAIQANSDAIAETTSKVTAAEGKITSQGTSITNLNAGLSTTNTNVAAAKTAAQEAATAAGEKGKVLYQTTAPAAADRLSQNLWIDTTSSKNTPKRWNGSAWVAVTDKVATDAATAAANALKVANTKADSTAVSALDSKVTTIDGTVTSQGTAITDLKASLASTNTTVATKATTAALNTTNAKVTDVDGKVTAITEDVKSLKSSVDSTNAQVAKKASTDAVSALTTRVDNTEKGITAQNDSLTTLRNRYNSTLADGVNLASATFETASLVAKFELVDGGYGSSPKSVRLKNNAGANYGEVDFRVLRGFVGPRVFKLSFASKITAAMEIANNIALQLAYTATNNTVYTSFPAVSRKITKGVVDSDWVVTTGYLTIPASAATVGIRLVTNNVNETQGTLLISACSVEDVTEAYAAQKTTDANTQAISGLQSSITDVEGKVTAQAASISKLTSDLAATDTKAGTAVKNAATAQTTANTAVTKADSAASSLSTLEASYAKSALAGANLLANSNVEGTYLGDGAYPHYKYTLGTEWEVGEKYTLIWCATHQRATGDTTSTLAAYAGGGNQSVMQFTGNGTRQVFKNTFTKSSSGVASTIHFYLLSKPANGIKTTATIHWAVLVKGDQLLTDAWIPSAFDYKASETMTNAAITTAQTTLANADKALGVRIDTITATVADNKTKSDAGIKEAKDATTALDKATSTKTSELTSSIKGLQAVAADLIPNPTFADTYGNNMGYTVVGTTTTGVPTGCPFPFAAKIAARDHNPSINGIPCKQGDVYEISALVACGAGTADFNLYVYKLTSPTSSISALSSGANTKTTAATAWTRVTWQWTVPASCNFFKPFLQINQQSPFGTIWYVTDWHCTNITAASKESKKVSDATAKSFEATNASVKKVGDDLAVEVTRVSKLKSEYDGKIAGYDETINTWVGENKVTSAKMEAITAELVPHMAGNTELFADVEISTGYQGVITALADADAALSIRMDQLQANAGDNSALIERIDNVKATLQDTMASQINAVKSEFKATVTDTIEPKLASLSASVKADYITKTDANTAIANATTTIKSAVKTDYTKAITDAVGAVKLDSITIPDTRSANQLPPWYRTNYKSRMVNEFKTATVIGLTAAQAGQTYVMLTTYVYYSDFSGGPIKQVAVGSSDDNTYIRYSTGTTSAETWGAWTKQSAALQATITQQAASINGVKAVKTVTIDNNGVMSGYGLISELQAGKVTSAFGVNADQFYVGSPSSGKKVFAVVNGTTVINDAIVGNLSAAKITTGTLSADRIAAGSIKATHLDVGALKATSLSSVSATIGLLRTKQSGARVEISDNLIQVFDSEGKTRIKLGIF